LKDAEQRLRRQNKLKAEAAAKAAEAKSSAQMKESASPAPSKGGDCSNGAQAEWEFLKQYEGAQSKSWTT
jgi:hypothetical protein